jgi:serine/threonine protein kinase
MTVVWSALDLDANRVVALKTLREDWEDQPTAIKLLRREARAGLEVHHDNLVKVLSAQVEIPPQYLVMEMLPGESLRGKLRREYCLETADAVGITRQTAQGVAALHAAKTLHGDVKPDNLWLTSAGMVVLIDLGFAHRPGENSSLLRKGYVIGTANYLAPELCDPHPCEDDLASDVFSLGVTLFEMLTGKLPYPPGTLTQIFRRHRSDPPADIRLIRPELPEQLLELVGDLLQRHPQSRPGIKDVINRLVGLEIASLRSLRSA